jgi:hypothetical protein
MSYEPKNIKVDEVEWQFSEKNAAKWTAFSLREQDEIEGRWFCGKENFTLGNQWNKKWAVDFAASTARHTRSGTVRDIRRHIKLDASELRDKRNSEARQQFLQSTKRKTAADALFSAYEYPSAMDEGYPCRLIADPGMSRLWSDLGSADPATDPKLLLLAWQMDADAMVDAFGFTVYTQDEFTNALAKVNGERGGCVTVEALSTGLDTLLASARGPRIKAIGGGVGGAARTRSPAAFSGLYNFCFRYARPFAGSARAKYVPLTSALALWRILLPMRTEFCLAEEFIAFMEGRPDMDEEDRADADERNVSEDLWRMVLVFFEDLAEALAQSGGKGALDEEGRIRGFDSGIYPDEIEEFAEWIESSSSSRDDDDGY